MIVKSIEKLSGKNVKVTMEDGISFPLYAGEIKRYSIGEEKHISDDLYEHIMEEIVYKRGRERAMYMLQCSDKTERQLRDKLAAGGYPEKIIEKIINFLKKYGYIDDYGYAVSFIKARKETMSTKMIKYKLMSRGIDKGIIENAFMEVSDMETGSEESIIMEIIRKKKFDYNNSGAKEKNRIIFYLLRKGFNYDDIMESIKKSSKNQW